MSERHYRRLNVGEILIAGDQYLYDGAWEDTTYPGCEVLTRDVKYRREIKTLIPEVGIFEVLSSFTDSELRAVIAAGGPK